MKILLFTEKTDYVKVIGLLADDIYKDIDVEVISECQLANLALSRKHDLIVIDDRLYGILNKECLEVLRKTQIDVIVFLQKKEHINRYLVFNLLDYFVSPLNWQSVDLRLRKQFKRMMALKQLDHEGEIPKKFVLRNKAEVHIINYSDILFFQKEQKVVRVHTQNICYESHESLKKIQSRLPESFIRVHSSYIVNFDNAKSILDIGNRSYNIVFRGYSDSAVMSRKRAEELMHDTINHYRLSVIHDGKG